MSPLILKRASASRSSGQWRDDDYDVLENGVIVGRIFQSPGAPQDRPWMWASGHNGDIRRAAHGYEPTRQAAMAPFAKSGSPDTARGKIRAFIRLPHARTRHAAVEARVPLAWTWSL
jgi:hypothetical protein